MARDPLQPRRCAELLAALAAPERLEIVRLLADGERNVTQITEALGIPPLNVSHHLTVLKFNRLIRGEKRGRFVWYALMPGVLEEAVEACVPKEALNLGCCRIEFPRAARPRPGRRSRPSGPAEVGSKPAAPRD
jgi:DNA-binding transcriptional ArsR family regulator